MPYPTSCYHTEYRCHTVSYISSMYRFSHPPRRPAQAIPGGKGFHLGRWHTRHRVAHNKETSTSIMAWYVFPPFFLISFSRVCPFPCWHLRSSHKLRHPLPATTHTQIHIHTHTSTRTGSKNAFSRQLRDRGFWHLQATTCSTTGILTPGAVRCLLSMISPSRFTNNCRALTVRGLQIVLTTNSHTVHRRDVWTAANIRALLKRWPEANCFYSFNNVTLVQNIFFPNPW